jgi:hypothetical protein
LQRCYIKLISAKKYRVVIATLLLVVYAFIATPVQLWHQHTYVASAKCASTANKKATDITVKSAQQTIVDANCAVCSHFYSAYSFVANVELEMPSLVLQVKHAFYIFSIPCSPLLNTSNKGPPELAA